MISQWELLRMALLKVGMKCCQIVRRFTTIRKSELVRADLDTMYSVVAKVDRYEHFVPMCSKSYLLSPSKGKLTVAKGPIAQTWTSELTFLDNEILAKNTTNYPLKFLNASMPLIAAVHRRLTDRNLFRVVL